MNPLANNSLLIFISHSSKDNLVVGELTNLLRSAFRLEASKIRNTSGAGTNLGIGVPIGPTLRQEIVEATVFVALLSRESVKSIYVSFEIGARWGTGGSLTPVLCSGLKADELPGPIKDLRAANCDEAGLLQLIQEVSQQLDRPAEPTELLLPQIQRLVTANVASTMHQPAFTDELPATTVDIAGTWTLVMTKTNEDTCNGEATIRQVKAGSRVEITGRVESRTTRPFVTFSTPVAIIKDRRLIFIYENNRREMGIGIGDIWTDHPDEFIVNYYDVLATDKNSDNHGRLQFFRRRQP